jgi:anti-anti-sigma factor
MQFDERSEGDVVILAPRGRLTLETFGVLKSFVGACVDRGCRRLVLNLARVSYADSIGIAEIIRAHIMLRRHGGRLKLSNLSPQVTTLLTIAGLGEVLETYDTEAAALASFSRVSDTSEPTVA